MTLVKTVALVGMMGAGKTAIGTRLAKRLEVPFADADHEIEQAARLSVKEIFEKYGEPHFRDGERRVIARLLGETPHVLATGGGAYMDDTTRAALRDAAFTIWLKVPVDILLGRVRKRQAQDQSRPLLNNDDVRGTLETLLAAREPIYAQADMVLESVDTPHGEIVDKIVAVLAQNGLCEAP
ncbi:MAG: shikimate kinase [Alphaproteobacteria bacterium]|nr:shikimate kinase [Alphaproteobacteria bacterium]MDB5739607.1 shikimate kinase [Alphaproteobacteria bacterium]